jgi:hypothetical protein
MKTAKETQFKAHSTNQLLIGHLELSDYLVKNKKPKKKTPP